MHNKLYNLTIMIISIVVIGISIRILQEKEYLRFILEMFSFFMFLAITLFFKKKKIFDISYIYYLVVIVINTNISPYYFTKHKIKEIFNNRIPFLKDYYLLYFSIYMFISIILLLYLVFLRNNRNSKLIKLKFEKNYQKSIILIGLFIAGPLSLFGGTFGNIVYIPILNAMFIYFLYEKNKKRVQYFFMLLYSVIIMIPYIPYRFKVIAFIFPLILSFILYINIENKNISYKKIIRYMIFGVIAILIYGVFSEVIKLNMFYNTDINIKDIFFNIERFVYFIRKQFYRIFGVWVVLGGSIITHVNNNGFFYGITYIKRLAPFFNLPYVDIAILSAKYVDASYAHAGLIIEGFANFGILGAVIAGIIPFFLLEFLFNLFRKKNTIFVFSLLTIPFVKTILDGGSIQMIIYNIFICYIIFSLIKIMKIILNNLFFLK